jgi:hypothetical protein
MCVSAHDQANAPGAIALSTRGETDSGDLFIDPPARSIKEVVQQGRKELDD